MNAAGGEGTLTPPCILPFFGFKCICFQLHRPLTFSRKPLKAKGLGGQSLHNKEVIYASFTGNDAIKRSPQEVSAITG